jgi:hypothetical protein
MRNVCCLSQLVDKRANYRREVHAHLLRLSEAFNFMLLSHVHSSHAFTVEGRLDSGAHIPKISGGGGAKFFGTDFHGSAS